MNAAHATARKFVMHHNQFGYDMYVADPRKTEGLEVTDRLEEAQVWADGYDNTKLKYWRALTSMDFQIKFIEEPVIVPLTATFKGRKGDVPCDLYSETNKDFLIAVAAGSCAPTNATFVKSTTITL